MSRGQKALWDDFAARTEGYYDAEGSLPRWLNKRLRNEIVGWLRDLPQGARVLDVACGRGELTGLIQNFRPDLRVIGMDLSSVMLDFADSSKGENSQTLFVQGRAECLPFKSSSFDAVILLNILILFSSDTKAPDVVQESCRVSRQWILVELRAKILLQAELALIRVLRWMPGTGLLRRLIHGDRSGMEKVPEIKFHSHDANYLFRDRRIVQVLKPWTLFPVASKIYVVSLNKER